KSSHGCRWNWNNSIVIGTGMRYRMIQIVIEMAEYAVKEQGEELILNSVQAGQIVEVFLSGDTYYNLLILAHHPHTFQGFYSTIVMENTSKNVKQVVSFVPLR
ncbi:hypothetical protein Csa_003293, partial [Cucumis sativus]